MTAHEDPDHGKGHCHHAWSVEGCYACWNQLPNDEIRHRLSSREVVELVGEAKATRAWAQKQGIAPDKIEETLRAAGAENWALRARVQELEAVVANLEAAFYHRQGRPRR